MLIRPCHDSHQQQMLRQKQAFGPISIPVHAFADASCTRLDNTIKVSNSVQRLESPLLLIAAPMSYVTFCVGGCRCRSTRHWNRRRTTAQRPTCGQSPAPLQSHRAARGWRTSCNCNKQTACPAVYRTAPAHPVDLDGGLWSRSVHWHGLAGSGCRGLRTRHGSVSIVTHRAVVNTDSAEGDITAANTGRIILQHRQ